MHLISDFSGKNYLSATAYNRCTQKLFQWTLSLLEAPINASISYGYTNLHRGNNHYICRTIYLTDQAQPLGFR